MPVIGFIVAVIGSAFYGAGAAIGLLTIFQLQGSQGWTGLEVLAVPMLAVEAATAGAVAAAISLGVPRTSLRRSDSFVMLVAIAVVVQTIVSSGSVLLLQMMPRHEMGAMILFAISMSGPVAWLKGGFNWNWLVTIPVTLAICSPWFRSRFDG